MSDLALPTREQLEALPAEQFQRLFSSMVAVAMRKTRPAGYGRGRAFAEDSVPAKLSALAVGQSVIIAEWRGANRLTSVTKAYARLRLDKEDANWTAKTTTKGVRVMRVR